MSSHHDAAAESRVRFTSDLHAEFGDFFFHLKQRALRLAAQESEARDSSSDYVLVHSSDIATAIRQALTEALTEIDDRFASEEPGHVRKAS